MEANNLKQLLEDEKSNDRGFMELPFHYYEIALMLIDVAKDDLEDGYKVFDLNALYGRPLLLFQQKMYYPDACCVLHTIMYVQNSNKQYLIITESINCNQNIYRIVLEIVSIASIT